jgi:hypothetical protein
MEDVFVAAMEDVLAVYTRPRDPDYPLVCLDETSKQFLAETRLPIPMKRGRPARCDYEYERNGTANLHDVCTARSLAPRQGHRSPYRCGLCLRLERIGRSLLRQRFPQLGTPGGVRHNRLS